MLRGGKHLRLRLCSAYRLIVVVQTESVKLSVQLEPVRGLALTLKPRIVEPVTGLARSRSCHSLRERATQDSC